MEEKSALKLALLLASNYCSTSEKCVFDVQKKLQQWKVDEALFDEIFTYLIKEKFIDEQRFTRAFVRDKFSFNRWGKIKIRHHLKQKQLPQKLVQEALQDVINEDEYLNTLKELIQQKGRIVKAKSEFEKKQKIIQFVASRGFEPHLAFEILGDAPDS